MLFEAAVAGQWQPVVLDFAPEDFDEVEFWSVRRKVVRDQPLFRPTIQPLPVDRIHELGRQCVPLQQAPEVQDRGFVRQCVVRKLQPGKPPQGFNLVQGVFQAGIRQGIPLLETVQPQHRRQGVGLTPTPASLGIVGLDDRQQRGPGYRPVHLGQELFSPGWLLLVVKGEGSEGGLFHKVTAG